jgi:Protein of unknown function (DUF2934)
MTTYREPSVEEITRRAYGLYLGRGGDHGHDVDDWVKAEKELGAICNWSTKIYLGQYQSSRRDCID